MALSMATWGGGRVAGHGLVLLCPFLSLYLLSLMSLASDTVPDPSDPHARCFNTGSGPSQTLGCKFAPPAWSWVPFAPHSPHGTLS